MQRILGGWSTDAGELHRGTPFYHWQRNPVSLDFAAPDKVQFIFKDTQVGGVGVADMLLCVSKQRKIERG